MNSVAFTYKTRHGTGKEQMEYSGRIWETAVSPCICRREKNAESISSFLIQHIKCLHMERMIGHVFFLKIHTVTPQYEICFLKLGKVKISDTWQQSSALTTGDVNPENICILHLTALKVSKGIFFSKFNSWLRFLSSIFNITLQFSNYCTTCC